MADYRPEQITMSPSQLQDLLKTAIAEAVGQATKLNPLEQRRLDEELNRDARRAQMMVQLGKIEEEAARKKREGCSHMRDAKTGDGVPRNWPTGEWTTGGQAYQNGLAMIICTRCSSTWLFRPDPGYYNVILQNGLMKAAPPPSELTICPGCFELTPNCKCAANYAASQRGEPVEVAA